MISYTLYMSLDDEPAVHDYQGARLTEWQIREILRLQGRIETGAYSFSFIEDLRDIASITYQRAYQSGDEEKLREIGPEVQVLDHLLHAARTKGPAAALKPDLEHLSYLAYLDQQQEAKMAQEEAEVAQANAQQMSLGELLAPEGGEAALEDLSFLPADVLADIKPLSTVPQIASTQKKLQYLILELRDAHEDYSPQFIIRSIEKKIAKEHEILTDQRAREANAKSYYRYNPRY